MPLYEVQLHNSSLGKVQPSSVSLTEREQLQPLVRECPECLGLGPDLLIIYEEFDKWDKSGRRIDLLGLHKDGNLVVIELKRVNDGSHMELQAIRYAAMVATMDFEDVVRHYEAFLAKHQADPSSARQRIIQFLGGEGDETPSIGFKPHIILFSPGFSPEITTTALWLSEVVGLDIRCVEYALYDLNGKQYLDIRPTIPLPTAEDYRVRVQSKSAKVQQDRAERTARRGKSLVILEQAEVLKPGTQLRLIKPLRKGFDLPPDTMCRAVFLARDSVRWAHDNREYSLNALTQQIWKQQGGAGETSFQSTNHWAIEGEAVSLTQRAEQVLISDTLTDTGSAELPPDEEIINGV